MGRYGPYNMDKSQLLNPETMLSIKYEKIAGTYTFTIYRAFSREF